MNISSKEKVTIHYQLMSFSYSQLEAEARTRQQQEQQQRQQQQAKKNLNISTTYNSHSRLNLFLSSQLEAEARERQQQEQQQRQIELEKQQQHEQEQLNNMASSSRGEEAVTGLPSPHTESTAAPSPTPISPAEHGSQQPSPSTPHATSTATQVGGTALTCMSSCRCPHMLICIRCVCAMSVQCAPGFCCARGTSAFARSF